MVATFGTKLSRRWQRVLEARSLTFNLACLVSSTSCICILSGLSFLQEMLGERERERERESYKV
jgi:hypothetical protein